MLAAMDQPPFARSTSRGLELRLKVVPGASRSQIAGVLGDHLKVRIAAPPEAGKANRAVIALIVDWLGTSRVTLVAGQTHPEKTVCVAGLMALTADHLSAIPNR